MTSVVAHPPVHHGPPATVSLPVGYVAPMAPPPPSEQGRTSGDSAPAATTPATPTQNGAQQPSLNRVPTPTATTNSAAPHANGVQSPSPAAVVSGGTPSPSHKPTAVATSDPATPAKPVVDPSKDKTASATKQIPPLTLPAHDGKTAGHGTPRKPETPTQPNSAGGSGSGSGSGSARGGTQGHLTVSVSMDKLAPVAEGSKSPPSAVLSPKAKPTLDVTQKSPPSLVLSPRMDSRSVEGASTPSKLAALKHSLFTDTSSDGVPAGVTSPRSGGQFQMPPEFARKASVNSTVHQFSQAAPEKGTLTPPAKRTLAVSASTDCIIPAHLVSPTNKKVPISAGTNAQPPMLRPSSTEQSNSTATGSSTPGPKPHAKVVHRRASELSTTIGRSLTLSPADMKLLASGGFKTDLPSTSAERKSIKGDDMLHGKSGASVSAALSLASPRNSARGSTITVGRTKLQDAFFKLKDWTAEDGAGKKPQPFDERFPNNSALLRYLLENVLDTSDVVPEPVAPAKGSSANNAAAARAPNQLHLAKLQRDGNVELAKQVRRPEFCQVITTVLGGRDKAAENLALRALFLILQSTMPPNDTAATFIQIVQSNCGGRNMNPATRNGLFAVLFHEGDQLIKDLDQTVTVSFGKRFARPQLLPAVFLCLQDCDLDIRRLLLEELNTVLIGAPENCKSITSHKQWHSWVWKLLLDVPRNSEDDKAKMTYSYAMNIFPSALFHSFMSNKTVNADVISTLDSLLDFAGPGLQSYQVAVTLLTSFVTKIKSNKKYFQQTGDSLGDPIWRNLRPLAELVVKFVFQTSHWMDSHAAKRGSTAIEDEKAAKMMAALTSLNAQRYILKERVGAQAPSYADLQEFGLHVNEQGLGGDLKMLQTLVSLFDELKLGGETDTTSMSQDDASFRKKLVQDHAFLVDAVELLETLSKASTVELYAPIAKKVSTLLQRFVGAATEQPKNRKPLKDEAALLVKPS